MTKLRLFYIANMRFPSERAHSAQVAHMCDAFVEEGAEVTLLLPNRVALAPNPFTYYALPERFTIERLPVFDLVRFGRIGFFIESLSFAWRVRKYLKKYLKGSIDSSAVLYSREELPLLFTPTQFPAFYEAHQWRQSRFFRSLIRRTRGIVAISEGVKNVLRALPYPLERVLVAHDGFAPAPTRAPLTEEIRRELGLPLHSKIALYIGGLEDWKGSRTLFEAAEELSRDGISVACIGGTETELPRLRKQFPLVLFLGPRPYRDLARNEQAGDVLIVPNSARAQISREFTSPLKLFSHLASGVPIVASNLPSLREVVSEREVTFFTPDDAGDLAETVRRVFKDPASSKEKAENARVKAAEYTWQKRARTILDFISKMCYNTLSTPKHN